MRHENIFPLIEYGDICGFLKSAWENGWLDDYAEDHFLIKAIEGRVTTFVGNEQMVNNNLNMQGIVLPDGTIDVDTFQNNFCVNLSRRMQFLVEKYGEDNIKRFTMDQLSAGKENYREDAFFEALSEVSILFFYAHRASWMEMLYEPPVDRNTAKNPETNLSGPVYCKMDGIENEYRVSINIEVKSPEFPHNYHRDAAIALPTVLLTTEGRKIVETYCNNHGIIYLPPRVLKLRDFINSAASKFAVPEKNEYNLLYINWSYRDFPSNSFLEPWALLTNEVNGILMHPNIANAIGVHPDALKKITAIIVYTESLEGLMFSDFRYVWQRNGVGPRFRMWVLDEELRHAELEDRSDVLFKITGMNPDKVCNQRLMATHSPYPSEDEISVLSELLKNIDDNLLT